MPEIELPPMVTRLGRHSLTTSSSRLIALAITSVLSYASPSSFLFGLPALLISVYFGNPAYAGGLKDYEHRVWTQQEGAPPDIGKLAQTSDGWLWIGTSDGVFRFDGARFEKYEPPGHPDLTNRQVTDMHAADNGDLYISYFPLPVAVVRRDGSYKLLPPTEDLRRMTPLSMLQDLDGALWTIGDGIRRFANGRWTTVESDAAWSAFDHYDMLLDQDGRLWASSRSGVWQLDRTQQRFQKVSDLGGGLAQAPNGDVWVFATDSDQALRIADSVQRRQHKMDGASAVASRAAGQFTSDGNMWSLGCVSPPCLVVGASSNKAVSATKRAHQEARPGSAGGRKRLAILEDQEGNIWFASDAGLSRYKPKRFVVSGMDLSDDHYSIASDRTGDVWVADTVEGKRWRLIPGRPPSLQPGQASYLLANGRDGSLLMAGKRHIVSQSKTGAKVIPLPPGQGGEPRDHRLMGMLDDGIRLWTESMDAGSIAWTGEGWISKDKLGLPSGVYLRQAGNAGQLWLATTKGELVLYDNGKLIRYDATPVNVVTGIFPGHPLVLAGTSGVAVLKNGKFCLLTSGNADALRSVSGLAVTTNGDRWLNGVAGVVHVRASDWQRAVEHPQLPLAYELFGSADGYPGRASLLSRQNTAITGDGRHVWFHASNGIVGLDSANVRRNTVAPQPVIQLVTTDTHRFQAGRALHLPPGSNSFQLHFTAPAFRQPERIRFEYQLAGEDAQWRSAGFLRSTTYTNIAPGTYQFLVRAINEDGVMSSSDAVLQLTIAPTFVQSLPFRLAVSLALAALLYTLYRLRVHHLTARVSEHYRIKLSERMRIARALHDTFLQTLQALVLRLSLLERDLPDDGRTRQQLLAMLDDAERLIIEGRDQVQELRASPSRMLDVVVKERMDGLQPLHPEVAFNLQVKGEASPLTPEIIEEAGLIACEAMRNAAVHAAASRVVTTIGYGRRKCIVSVHDNGRGIAPDVTALGHRRGHWGLIGMHERANLIKGRLRIDSAPGKGTTVTLSVPG